MNFLNVDTKNIIFEKAIQVDNCNAGKLRTSCKSFYNNRYIKKLQLERNVCNYCKYIWREWDNLPTFITKPGKYSDFNGEVLCKTHQYYCKSCDRVGSYNNYLTLHNMCKKCAKTNIPPYAAFYMFI